MDAVGEMDVIHFDTFHSADRLVTLSDEAVSRRFGTLLVVGEMPHGINRPSRVYHVKNTAGESFALKVLGSLRRAGDAPSESSEPTPPLARSFLEEYRNQVTVSNVNGFASAYGRGVINGSDAILMQWVEGPSLARARLCASHAGEKDGVGAPLPSARTVASLGLSVIRVLDRTDHFSQPFVHRDLSPNNILIRTDLRPLEEQVSSGNFDIYLIDMGSVSLLSADALTFTMQFNLFRNGTPIYAAPEMLTNDIENVDALRQSPTIDVYALCSILYELYGGMTPYAGLLLETASPYRTKMDNDPLPLEARCEADRPLVEAIMAGIKSNQDERISRRELKDRLSCWLGGRPYAPSEPPDGGAVVYGFGIIDPARGIYGRLSDYSWTDLAQLARRIAACETDDEAVELAIRHNLLNRDGSIPFNSVKPVRLADGTRAGVRIVGLRHDPLADGSGVAGLSLMFTGPLAARPMNSRDVAHGGWESCEARAWLDQEALGLLPADLSSAIRTVTKSTNNVGGTKDVKAITPTSDRLWLPSYTELVGIRLLSTFTSNFRFLAGIMNGEGSQYQLFRERRISRYEHNDELRLAFHGESCYWWLRSPSPDVSLSEGITCFNRVGPDGDPFHYAIASTSLETTDNEEGLNGVNTLLPGFCL